MRVLIGHTGFVGSFLKNGMDFDLCVNRSNIEQIHNLECDIVCCGLPAEKWKANLESQKDYDNVLSLIANVRKAKVKSFTLISTVDVYGNPINVDENTIPFSEQPYGKNRLFFEKFVSQYQHQIIRLPGLFGTGLKKNIIYDLMNDNNIDKINSNSYLQWYPMNRFVNDLQIIMKRPEITTFNICTEPVHTKDLAKQCFGVDLPDSPEGVKYDMRTIHANLFGRSNYLMTKTEVIDSVKDFV